MHAGEASSTWQSMPSKREADRGVKSHSMHYQAGMNLPSLKGFPDHEWVAPFSFIPPGGPEATLTESAIWSLHIGSSFSSPQTLEFQRWEGLSPTTSLSSHRWESKSC